MALPYPINANQTDAKSPIDQQLMDALRLNQDYLEGLIGAATSGGVLNFRVNGYLTRIRALLSQGAGKRLDGGIITNAVTFTKANLFLDKTGDSGSLEVDVLRHKNVDHPIDNIEAQYSDATQSIGKLGSAITTQAVSIASPIVNTQTITRAKVAISVESVTDLGDGTTLYTFSGTTLLDNDYQIGDGILFASCGNAANDGTYNITKINYDGLPSVVVDNAAGVTDGIAAGTAELNVMEFTYLASVDTEYVVGESVIMAGHTSGNNNGTFVIRKLNVGGNNIWLGVTTGTTQGAPAGTAQCTRWVHSYASPVEDTHYIVGETTFMSGHVGTNNGSLVIRKVNSGANNLYVTNLLGAAQAGAGGTASTERWVYSMPTDPSTDDDVEVGDLVKFSGHGLAVNDGVFEVKVVNRFAIDNIEVYNPAGEVQFGVAGNVEHTKKIVTFKEDFSALYVADTSKVELQGITTTDVDQREYDVAEINRGIGAFNIVVHAENIAAQANEVGRVAREIRTIFIDRPKITVDSTISTRNLVTNNTATFIVDPIEADTILTLEILEVPLGLPSTMVLSLT